MTMRERMLGVVQGRAHDRVPFVQYSGLAAPDKEVWSMIGRDNMGLLAWTGIHRVETPNCRVVREDFARNGRQGFRRTLHTPEGTLFEERLIEPTYGTSSAHVHFVKAPEDYRVLMAYLRDMRVTQDLDALRAAVRALGDDGLPHVALPRTPYQQLWVEWVSLSDLGVHLGLYPDLMEEVTSLMFEVQREVFRVACDAVAGGAPVPYLDFGDNITAPAIGPDYFRKYCVASYDELAQMLADTGRDIPIFVHMDGELKPLQRAIALSAVRGIDSFAPLPDNDNDLGEAAAAWPEMRFLVNFPSSVHLAEPDAIRRQTEQLLAEAGHTGRLQIQISENVPPGIWRGSFPQIVQAIRDFGAPDR